MSIVYGEPGDKISLTVCHIGAFCGVSESNLKLAAAIMKERRLWWPEKPILTRFATGLGFWFTEGKDAGKRT